MTLLIFSQKSLYILPGITLRKWVCVFLMKSVSTYAMPDSIWKPGNMDRRLIFTLKEMLSIWPLPVPVWATSVFCRKSPRSHFWLREFYPEGNRSTLHLFSGLHIPHLQVEKASVITLSVCLTVVRSLSIYSYLSPKWRMNILQWWEVTCGKDMKTFMNIFKGCIMIQAHFSVKS